ncbi:MAG TPA: secretin N-terminal domain-containing protein [Rhodocyclaceae bacterium]
MKARLLCAALISIAVSACSPTPFRTDAVYEQAKAELAQAKATQKAEEAEEKALLPPLTLDMPKNAEVEPRFDLSVVNAPASQVFMALVTGTPYNMLVTPEVSGQITIRLKDVTVKEALESIRELYGYEFTIKGNRITIQPNTLQTRIFQINYLASKRRGMTSLRVTSGASNISGSTPGATPGTPQPTPSPTGTPGTPGGPTTGTAANVTTQVQTTTDSDFWGDLKTALTAIVGSDEGRSVVVNEDSGMIVVRAMPKDLRSVDSYLKATQLVVERQVVLEAKVIDVTLSRDYQAGINWAAFKSGNNSHAALGVSGATADITTRSGMGGPLYMNTGDSSYVTPGKFGSVVAQSLGKGFFGLALQTANFAALLNFLETQGSVSVLSSPRIATLNNQKAVLKVGTDDLFVTGITTTTTTTTTGNPIITPTVTLQSYFSGIALDVTPQIDEDNNIILHVHPAVSVVTEKTKTLNLGSTIGTYVLPLASSSVNETDAIVRARDGNIIAIGGLMRQEQDLSNTQLPGAEKLGAAGSLLGQRGNTLTKRELVILLKPTVISADAAWAKDINETNERLRGMDPIQFSLEK